MSFIRVQEHREHSASPLDIFRKAWGLAKSEKFSGITIISAFTDPVAIERVIDEIGAGSLNKKIVKVCLDFGASCYLRDERTTNHLNAIAEKLAHKFAKESGIFLISLGRFLHSKIIVLHNKSVDRASLGSLNFTCRALFSNEEILSNITDASELCEIQRYIDYLFAAKGCRKVPFELQSSSSKTKSSRDWLLAGSLFFEDKASSPYNFKLGLPSDLLKQPALIIPGALAEVPDNISLMQLLEIPRAGDSLQWKRYCIPTCYGYWCPRQLTSLANAEIENAVAEKRNNRIEPVLRKEKALKKKFTDLFDRIELNIKKYNNSKNTNHLWDKDRAIGRLEKWIPRIVRKLRDKEHLWRLLAGVNETIVPDFWSSDEVALREFEESFCSHVVYELSKSRVQNWIALWLRDYFVFGKDQSFRLDWDGNFDDEDVWLEWLRNQNQDPFETLPELWGL